MLDVERERLKMTFSQYVEYCRPINRHARTADRAAKRARLAE
jgi:hypothetical protein